MSSGVSPNLMGLRLGLCTGLALVCGCGSGGVTGSIVYVRRANVGLDLDTLPAVVELAVFGCDEEVVIPAFVNGEAPAVLAKVCRPPTHLTGDWLTIGKKVRPGRTLLTIGRMFACGGAAMALTAPSVWAVDAGTAEDIGGLRESDTNRTTWRTRGGQRKLGSRSGPAVYNATTSVGFGFELNAATWEPAALRAGFHRKETYVAAFPAGASETYQADRRHAGTPSVFALLDGALVEGDGRDTQTDKGASRARRAEARVQFFATGRSATETCLRPDVRSVILKDLIQYPRVVKEGKHGRDWIAR